MKIFFYKTFLFLILSLFSYQLVAQYSTSSNRAIKKFEEAKNFYQQRDDVQALQKLEEAIEADKNFIEAYILRGEIFFDHRKYEEMVESYEKILEINPEFSNLIYFYLSEGYINTGRYDEAQKCINKFLSYSGLSATQINKAKNRLKQCDFAIYAKAHPVEYEPINMGAKINTEFAEYLPALTLDENTLVVTTCYGGDYNMRMCQEDFFISKKVNGEWQQAVNLGAPLNTNENEGAQTISADGNLMFFTACNRVGGMGSCDIYFSMKVDGQWLEARNLGFPVNTNMWESQPSFSADGRTLYYTSNRQGGLGNKDIWMSVLQNDGSWSRPENLGYQINTEEEDMSPFIHPDNNTLYFASDGRVGMGSLDLYVVRKDAENNWGTPVNLGYPINTHEEESGLIVNSKGDLAFFSTDRLGGFGSLDLYQFNLHEAAQPTAVTYVHGNVFNAETKAPLMAKCQLFDLDTEKKVMEIISNSVTGEFLVPLPTNKGYALNISKDGFLFYSENFSLEAMQTADKTYEMQIPLQPIKAGEVVILRNVFFDTDSYVLLPESNVELDKLVEFLTKNQTIRIEIGGHTDNVGSEEHNKILSENRAKAVYDYLVLNGINAGRLTYYGFGFSKPIAPNDTEQGRALNRRTEFKIL